MSDFGVQGKNVDISFDFGEGLKVFVCARSFSLEQRTELIETTTPSSGKYNDYEGQAIDWSLTVSGILVIESSNTTGLDLLGAQVVFKKMPFKLLATDDNGTEFEMTGTVIVETSQLSGETAQFVNSDITFRGCGQIPEIDSGQGGGGNVPGQAIKQFQYTAVGGETELTRVDWIGADMIYMSRDGREQLKIEPPASPAVNQMLFDVSLGRVEFSSPAGPGEVFGFIYET